MVIKTNNFGKIIKSARRMDDIMSIIGKTIAECENYGGSFYINTLCVSVKTIKSGMIHLREIINGTRLEFNFDELNQLNEYTRRTADILLHNYAVSISHHHNPEDKEDFDRNNQPMSVIRSWLILDSLIDHLLDSADDSWYIPDGWKRRNANADDDRYVPIDYRSIDDSIRSIIPGITDDDLNEIRNEFNSKFPNITIQQACYNYSYKIMKRLTEMIGKGD